MMRNAARTCAREWDTRAFIRRGTRVLISGHGPQNPDGTLALPLGKLGRELSVDQGYAAARLTGLSLLGSLKRAPGDLSFALPAAKQGRSIEVRCP